MPVKNPTHGQLVKRRFGRGGNSSVRSRLSACARGYGRRWQKRRTLFLLKNPLCRICEAAGRTEAATCVDHIKPHKGDQGLFWDEDNWQGLCDPCHSKKTAAEDGGFGNKRRAVV